jgi:Holliday junction DNA helicase RuvA
MIAHLRGQVLARTEASVVVDVQGVGYLVHLATTEGVPPRGREVALHTSLQVREDSMTLYGFPDADGLRLFELLLTSSGVGPRLALATLATLPPGAIATAIAGGDIATLTTVPGIGKKVAERMVLELRDRVDATVDGSSPSGPSDASLAGDVLAEVRAALAGFGFSPVEIRTALGGLERTDEDTSASLLRRALRVLGPGGELSA